MRAWPKRWYAIAAILLAFAVETATPAAAADTSRFLVGLQNSYSFLCLATSRSGGEQPVVVADCGEDVTYWDIVDQSNADQPNQHQIATWYPQYKCVAARGKVESPAVATGCTPWYFDQLWSVRHDYATDLYQFQNINSKLCLAARSATAQAVQTTCDTTPGRWPDQWWWLIDF